MLLKGIGLLAFALPVKTTVQLAGLPPQWRLIKAVTCAAVTGCFGLLIGSNVAGAAFAGAAGAGAGVAGAVTTGAGAVAVLGTVAGITGPVGLLVLAMVAPFWYVLQSNTKTALLVPGGVALLYSWQITCGHKCPRGLSHTLGALVRP